MDMAEQRRLERLQKLKQLRKRAAESEELNKKEVFEEHQRNSVTKKDEIRSARKREEAEKLLAQKEAEEKNLDYERVHLLKFTAEEVEEWEKKQKKKAKRANNGFADWDEANLKKHKRLISQIKPDLEEYEEQKMIATQVSKELLYRNADSLEYGDLLENKPSEEAVDRMAQEIDKQQKIRKKHSRTRALDTDSDISYINDRNMRFNQKISRVYDKYLKD